MNNMKGYLDLAAAVVEQAQSDLFDAYFYNDVKMRIRSEKWFTSDYGNTFCLQCGHKVITRTQEEARELKGHITAYSGRSFYTDIEVTPAREEVLGFISCGISNNRYIAKNYVQLKTIFYRLRQANLL